MLDLDGIKYLARNNQNLYADVYYRGHPIRICGKIISYDYSQPHNYTSIKELNFRLMLEHKYRASFSCRVYDSFENPSYCFGYHISFVYACGDADGDQIFGRPGLILEEEEFKWE